ncbi:radical SAM protein [Candidatus Bathyarchaeota archaeon]|nr:radical SAM protein [Candidatus Bathyarchaeota archaeon]
MKVLLIFPNYLESFHIISASFYPPLGLAMIAAVLKDQGHAVTVVDATAERMNIKRLMKHVKSIKPDLIGITANISYANKANVTGRMIKQRFNEIPVIFGGPYPTTRFERLLRDGAGDFIVLGEGERTVVDLVDALESNTHPSTVEGIAFLDDGEIITTPARERCVDLDALPYPAWELFPKHRKYFWNPKGRRYYPVMTSRGCPYGCINCTKAIHGYKIRYRSVENVIGEMQYLHDHFGADEAIIIDDGFNHDINHAECICDAIADLDFKMHLRFTNGLRADKITPRLAWKLKNAGAYDIVLGIESGNQQVVNKMGKNLDLDMVRKSVMILKKVGITTSGFFMVGIPGETVSTMIDTKQMIRELQLDRALISRVIPFPGTKLHDIVKRDGRVADDFERRTIFYSHKEPAFELNGLPSELIELAFQDYYRTAYLNPRRMFQYLKTIRWKNLRVHLNFAITTLFNLFKHKTGKKPHELREKVLEKLKSPGNKHS